MKKSFNLLMLAAIAAAAFSCTKENVSDNPSQKAEGEGTPLSITVGTETKTLLRPSSDNPGEVHWGKDDKIKVFNQNKQGSLFGTTKGDVKEATFTCETWVGETPIVAVHSNKASESTCTDLTSRDNPKVKTYLNPTQVIKHKQSYALAASASIGLVSGTSPNYSIAAMKNLFSLIQFRVNDTSIVKITMTGTNNEVLAGWMNVDYNNGNPTCTPVDDNDAKSLVITATGSACKVSNSGRFYNGTTYYISVLPQILLNGFTLELQKENGAKATREISSDVSVTLNRNEIRALKHPLDSALYFDPLTIDFKESWPFIEKVKASSDQKTTGDEDDADSYTYVTKSISGNDTTVTFKIAANGAAYTAPTGMVMKAGKNAHGTWIKLPAIEGRKLCSVYVEVSNTSSKTFSITPTNTYDQSTAVLKKTSVVKDSPVTFHSYKLAYNTSYYIYLNRAHLFQLTRLTLIYGR